MKFDDVSELYRQIQRERNYEPDLSFQSLSLPAFILDSIPTVKTEVQPEAKLFGIPIREVEWMPEGMGMAETACHCTAADRLTDKHIGKHVVILDFRADGQKKADAEKYG